MSRQALWRFLAVALPTLGALIAPLPSVDLAFQLRAGSEIVATGAIPTADTWTFTVANTPWVDQQWAAQVLLQGAFAIGGWTGLVVLRAALVGVAFGLLLFVVRRRAPALPAAAGALLVISAFIVAAPALALRPQLFAIVLLAAVLAILVAREARPRLVWAISVIALAWANFHGTFLFVPALCGLAWFADLFDRAVSARSGASTASRRAGSPHAMLVVGLVSLGATLLNPFGIGAWTYVVSITSDPSIAGRVSEWQAPNPLTAAGAVVWISVLAVAALAIARVRDAFARSTIVIPWPALLTLAVFGGLALVSGRGQAWWPLVAVYVIPPWAEARLKRLMSAVEAPSPPTPRPDPLALRRLNVAIAAILVLAGAALLPAWRPTGAVGVPNGTLTYAPQGIAAELRLLTAPATPSCDDRIWNPQPWGSWLELEAPCARYATDSRIELYPATVWDDAEMVDAGTAGWNAILAAEGATAVVTDRTTEPDLETALRGSAGWTRAYADCDGSVWVLAGSPIAATIPSAPAPAPASCP